jgi:hypothetical protein
MIVSLGISAASTASALSLADSSKEIDPVVGTFKLNVRKSRSSNALPFIDGTIRGIDEGNGVLRMFYERVMADGTKTTLHYTYRPDCVDCPVSGGPDGLTVFRTQIGKRTYKTIWKLNGRVITISRNTYSRDFKVLTNRADNVDERGSHYETVTVWDRQ